MIKSFFKHPEIQLAITAGLTIIAQAYFYKKVLHIEQSGLLYLIPGFVILIYETMAMSVRANEKKKEKNKGKRKEDQEKLEKTIDPKYLKPIYWHGIIILSTILSILIPYLKQ